MVNSDEPSGRQKVMGTAARYWRTLRHFSAAQIFYLLVRRVLHWPRVVALPAEIATARAFSAVAGIPGPQRSFMPPARFRFLARERDFGEHIDWRAPGETLLWQYNLHYFEWLREADCDTEQCQRQIDSWIDANPPYSRPAWDAYTTSLRIVNWILFSKFQPLNERVVASLARQALWLAASLEHHIRANHLFTNLKGLLFAAIFFDGTIRSKLVSTVGKLMARELDEQFLDDGGHYERSPMYHHILTRDLMELSALLRANPGVFGESLARRLYAYSAKALQFARAMAHPDRTMARFNDSADGIAPTLDALESYAASHRDIDPHLKPNAEIEGAIELRDSGYYAIRTGEGVLIVDCGSVGPGYQPGHAHCDTLSFEFSKGGRRLLVNSGVYEYQPGARRAYCRSTAAHNTMVINSVDQSEVWGAFRLGRRANPLFAELVSHDEGWTFRGAHDGYWHLPEHMVHEREIKVSREMDLTIQDRVTGEGSCSAEVWLHAVEGAHLRRSEANSDAFKLVIGETVCANIEVGRGPECTIEQTPRYPEFGREVTGESLKLTCSGSLPIAFEYQVRTTHVDGYE